MNEPKQEEGYILIAAKDFTKYEPKLATDEFKCEVCKDKPWHMVETHGQDDLVFKPETLYRRKINPAVVYQARAWSKSPDEEVIDHLTDKLEKCKSALAEISKIKGGDHTLYYAVNLAAKTLKEVE